MLIQVDSRYCRLNIKKNILNFLSQTRFFYSFGLLLSLSSQLNDIRSTHIQFNLKHRLGKGLGWEISRLTCWVGLTKLGDSFLRMHKHCIILIFLNSIATKSS